MGINQSMAPQTSRSQPIGPQKAHPLSTKVPDMVSTHVGGSRTCAYSLLDCPQPEAPHTTHWRLSYDVSSRAAASGMLGIQSVGNTHMHHILAKQLRWVLSVETEHLVARHSTCSRRPSHWVLCGLANDVPTALGGVGTVPATQEANFGKWKHRTQMSDHWMRCAGVVEPRALWAGMSQLQDRRVPVHQVHEAIAVPQRMLQG